MMKWNRGVSASGELRVETIWSARERERRRGIDSLNHVRVAAREPVTGVALLCTGCGPDLCDVGRLAHIARGLLEELVMDRGRHQQLPVVWGLRAVVLLGGWHGPLYPTDRAVGGADSKGRVLRGEREIITSQQR